MGEREREKHKARIAHACMSPFLFSWLRSGDAWQLVQVASRGKVDVERTGYCVLF